MKVPTHSNGLPPCGLHGVRHRHDGAAPVGRRIAVLQACAVAGGRKPSYNKDMTNLGRQTERGHETPFLRHFALFLPNRVGQLAELLSMLEKEQLSLVAMAIVDATDWAVVRLIFSDPLRAREKLLENNVAFTESDVLGVLLDEPDTFTRVCKSVVAAELNIFYAFPLLIRSRNKPVMAFRVDDEVLAIQILTKHGFTLLGYEDAKGMDDADED